LFFLPVLWIPTDRKLWIPTDRKFEFRVTGGHKKFAGRFQNEIHDVNNNWSAT
jgi:hypothetical protein